MLLCFFFGMFGRMFWEECKCRPPREDKDEFEKQKTLNSTLFYILAILVLVLDQLVFVGNGRVDTAVATLEDSSGTVKDITYDMYAGGTKLISLVGSLSSAYNESTFTCDTNSTALSDLQGNITQYASAAQSYTDSILPVQNFLDDIDSGISKYGVLYRQLALYFIWALAIVFSGGLITLKWWEFRYGMKQVMWFGICTYALYVCLCLPWTYATSMLADICIEPSYNAVKSMPVEDSIRNIGTYFSTCTGNCTLTNALTSARESVYFLNATAVSLLRTDCANNTALLELRAVLETVDMSIDGVAATMSCKPIQDEWFTFWNDGVCQHLYTGTFLIWGSQILTSLFLFVLIVCVSITYQFYGDPKAPYPTLLSHSKVLPVGGVGVSAGPGSAGSAATRRTEGERDRERDVVALDADGFGVMEQPSPARQAPAINRVLSFHSDISEELNGSFF